jgi:hypothetical protein
MGQRKLPRLFCAQDRTAKRMPGCDHGRVTQPRKPAPATFRAEKPSDETSKADVPDASVTSRLRRQEILKLFGQIDYDPDYDYKKERKARRRTT